MQEKQSCENIAFTNISILLNIEFRKKCLNNFKCGVFIAKHYILQFVVSFSRFLRWAAEMFLAILKVLKNRKHINFTKKRKKQILKKRKTKYLVVFTCVLNNEILWKKLKNAKCNVFTAKIDILLIL